jgi:hypothetical protein
VIASREPHGEQRKADACEAVICHPCQDHILVSTITLLSSRERVIP